jgi:hypothetical protein
VASGIDPGWDRVVARCLERDPARRYPDFNELGPAVMAMFERRATIPFGRGPSF